MIIAKGKMTYITKLNRHHVDQMQLWGRHESILFQSYNFPQMNKEESDSWYRVKTYSLTKKCYVVYDLEDKLVGYMALRNIQWIKRISEIGIVFNPDNLSSGYGTDSLNSFIGYYFEKLKMNRLNLKVSVFNTRAQRCYEKCGFDVSGVKFYEFEDQDVPIFKDESLADFREFFRVEKGVLECQYIEMYLIKEKYYQNK